MVWEVKEDDILNIPYLTFLKHAEKVVKDVPESKPVLKGVYHSDGFVYATNSFCLYKAKSSYTAGEGEVVDVATGQILAEGRYPNVKTIIPTKDPLATIGLNVRHAIDALKALQQVGTVPTAPGRTKARKKDVILKLDIEGEWPTISTIGGTATATYELQALTAGSEQIKTAFNSNYMIQALELFKDALPLNGDLEITLKIYGAIAPLVLAFEDSLMALIISIRI